MARARVFLLALLAAACSPRVANNFQVEAPGAVSAELQLCGQTTRLDRAGDRFTGARTIDCEGEGDIVLSYAGGPSISCHVGYVTAGAGQTFRYRTRDGRCAPVLDETMKETT